MTSAEHVAHSSEWHSRARPTSARPAPARPGLVQPSLVQPSLVRSSLVRPSLPEAAHQPRALENVPARERRSTLLEQLVKTEILPRLTLARSGTSAQTATTAAEPATMPDETTELVHLLLSTDGTSASVFVDRLQARGASAAALYLGIITQAARALGELWQQDRCDFAQVTISLGRLQQIVRALSPNFQTGAPSKSVHADTALLLPAPGEQHSFGLVILAEFFRREGWNVTGGPVSTGYDAASLVRGTWVDVAGFSIGSMQCLDALTRCIHAVRKASRNRSLAVLVGGPLLLERPDLVGRVGADATAIDAPSAVRQASGLLAMQAAAD